MFDPSGVDNKKNSLFPLFLKMFSFRFGPLRSLNQERHHGTHEVTQTQIPVVRCRSAFFLRRKWLPLGLKKNRKSTWSKARISYLQWSAKTC